MTLPGDLIAVADARLHVVVDSPKGVERGRPVLLSSGLGGAWFDWQPSVDLLRGRYHIINFDRPGLGGSPPERAAPSLHGEMERLAALARWAGPPVIIAAHSFAAFHAEAVARTHPELVAGLVLVDPSYERGTRPRVRLSRVITPVARAVGRLAGMTGAARLFGPPARSWFMRQISHRDAASPALVREVYGRGDVIGAALAENAVYGEMAADLADLRSRRPFPEIPLVVLTALGDLRLAGRRRAWTECHRRLAAMSPYGRQIILESARHLVQTDQPDAIADALEDLQ